MASQIRVPLTFTDWRPTDPLPTCLKSLPRTRLLVTVSDSPFPSPEIFSPSGHTKPTRAVFPMRVPPTSIGWRPTAPLPTSIKSRLPIRPSVTVSDSPSPSLEIFSQWVLICLTQAEYPMLVLLTFFNWRPMAQLLT